MSERSDADYAIEFAEYMAKAAEQFMAEQNRAFEAEEAPDPEFWGGLESVIYEFRKRAAKVVPPAPAPDEAVIRAELVAALRGVMALVPNISHGRPRPTFGAIYPAMQRAHAALARADAMDQALTRDVPSSPGITHEL